MTDSEQSKAVISDDGLYRYQLERVWDPSSPPMVFVMLNPSTADASLDDPTIRRCRGFAKTFGAGSLVVVNLFAYRASKPAALWSAKAAGVDVQGALNRSHWSEVIDRAGWVMSEEYGGWGDGALPIVCAWGADPKAAQQAQAFVNFVDQLDRRTGVTTQLSCLGNTATGQPRHPLYVKGDQPLVEYAAPVAS